MGRLVMTIAFVVVGMAAMTGGPVAAATPAKGVVFGDEPAKPAPPAAGAEAAGKSDPAKGTEGSDAPGRRQSSGSAGPTTKPVDPAKLEKRRAKYVAFYCREYGKSLEHTDWITRSMAVISLSRIDDDGVTEMILDVLERPFVRGWRAKIPGEAKPGGAAGAARPRPRPAESPLHGLGGSYATGAWAVGNRVVRLIAWEALHARNASLSPEQRARWIAATQDLAKAGEFRGAMRVGMLRLLAPRGPTPQNIAMFKTLFARTNALLPYDVEILRAMRDVLRTWQSRELARYLISALRSLHDAPRADWLLRAFEADIPLPKEYVHKGTRALWPAYYKQWNKWLATCKFAPPKPGSIEPYKGTSTLLPPPEKIDPDNPKWRKDLELPRLRLQPLDVVFAIDSTGSMGGVIDWIKRDVERMMKAFALISREPRIGITFYRDEKDEYVTRSYRLTDNGRKLTQAIRGVRAGGGGDLPEAVYQALGVVVSKQPWSKTSSARKVIVIVGDAPPHKEDMPAARRLAAEAAKHGFIIHCISAGRPVREFQELAHLGGGKHMEAVFAGMGSMYYSTSVDVCADRPSRTTPLPGLPGRLPGGFPGRVVVPPRVPGAGPAGAPAPAIPKGPGIGEPEKPDPSGRPSPAARGAQPSARDAGRADRILLREVLSAILTKEYRDRAEPFINILLEYLDQPLREQRTHVPPRSMPGRVPRR